MVVAVVDAGVKEVGDQKLHLKKILDCMDILLQRKTLLDDDDPSLGGRYIIEDLDKDNDNDKGDDKKPWPAAF